MKLIFIRHGEPDYTIDSLTEKGWREAALLAERIAPMHVDEYYCSTKGRAKDTASLTLKKAGRTAQYCDWLREFDGKGFDPYTGQKRPAAWDLLPRYYTAQPEFFDYSGWKNAPYSKNGTIIERYDYVAGEIDALLEQNGYRRSGMEYTTAMGNEKTLVFFCHFGVTCIIMSHLMGLPPMILLHNFCEAPTGVTTLCTEEREKGHVIFRCLGFGDTSHLYAAGEEISFAGRFCETYERSDQRHD